MAQKAGSIAKVPAAASGPQAPIDNMLSCTGTVRKETDKNSEIRNSVQENRAHNVAVAAIPPMIMGRRIRKNSTLLSAPSR